MTIQNRPPSFDAPLPSPLTLNLNQTSLLSYSDPDGHAVSVTFAPSQPSFISIFSATQLFINPYYCTNVGTHTFSMVLSDTNMLSPTYTMTVIILANRPPKYLTGTGTTSYPSITIALNSVKTQTIPSFYDLDGSAVQLTLSEPVLSTAGPLAIFLATSNLMQVAPTQFSEVGFHTIKVTLSDICGDIL